MRKYRFFYSNNIEINSIIELDNEQTHQIKNVLRLKINNVLHIFNNTEHEYTAEIIDISNKKTLLKILEQNKTNTENKIFTHLGQVLGKNQKLDFIIQKATELGVNSITPLYSKRSIGKIKTDKIDKKLEHYSKIALSACCQSGRLKLVNINKPMLLENWLEKKPEPKNLILDPYSSTELKNINLNNNTDLQYNNSISITIGPEGGFDTKEIDLAVKNNFINISLGNRILRTETAGLAVLAILNLYLQ